MARGDPAPEDGQLSLLGAPSRRAAAAAPPPPLAAHDPVARVVLEGSLPHLDRVFDYAVPESLASVALPGVRVRVRFAGRDVDGFVLERAGSSDFDGTLARLRRVVSPEPVLSPEIAALARAVADRCAGTMGDVLRLAVPPRHAATEKQPTAISVAPAPTASPPPTAPTVDAAVRLPDPDANPWTRYQAAPAFLARVAAGQGPWAVWTALPGTDWARALAVAAATAVASGRGAVLVLPDRRDVDAVESALVAVLGPGQHARLEADLGPAARYAAFLALRRGAVRVAVGTRAAAFAPVHDPGLVAVWDDGDDQHAEPRAPYPHVREVLLERARRGGAAVLIGGWSRTVAAQALVRDGLAHGIEGTRGDRRHRWPRVCVAGSAGEGGDPQAAAARIPTIAWRAVQQGLRQGTVLVQVPRAGYLPSLGCGTCRAPARCPACHGPLKAVDRPHPLSVEGVADEPPGARPGVPVTVCGWCARPWPVWTCPRCGGHRLRARTVGVERTAQELARSFAGASLVVSRPGRMPASVGGVGTLVVATPGVEPVPEDGYAAAVLLDGDTLLARADLRAGEEALRRWAAAAALVRPAEAGGLVVLCADPEAPAVQALVRGDPVGFAERELSERQELGLPPCVAAASVTGEPEPVAEFLAGATLPPGTQTLGPIPVDEVPGDGGPSTRGSANRGAGGAAGDLGTVRYVLRARREQAGPLAAALHEAAAARSARRRPGLVRVRMDPLDLG